MDELPYLLLALLLGLYLLVGPALGIAAFQGGRQITRELLKLRQEVARLAERLAEAERALGGAEEQPATVEAQPAEVVAEEAPAAAAPAAAPAAAEAEPAPPQASRAPRPAWLERLIDNVKHNWVIWLAALTVALGGAFLVKYSIERGWIGPLVRVLAGGLLGFALLFAGEALRRRPLALGPDHLPVGLSAAGAFLLFASSYAAYALYGFLGPFPAFLLLAAVALLAVLLSLLQGLLLALLGLLGAFAVPALVTTEAPQAWSFFAYLTAVSLSALPLLRMRGWWSLGWAALAGSLIWSFLWFVGAWQARDPLSPCLHVLIVGGAYLLARGGSPSFSLVGWPRGFAPLSSGERLAWGAGLYAALLSFALVRMDGYEAISLATLFLLSVLLLTAARREDALDGLAVLAALAPLASLATWHLPALLPSESVVWEGAGPALGLLPVVPPEFTGFLLVAGLFALLFGLAGFLLLRGARRPWIWGGLSAVLPLLLLALAYWRLEGFALDLGWTGAALALAALAATAAGLTAREEGQGGALVLAAYAAATTAAIGLGAAMALREAWLTVVLAGELPVLAWIALKLGLPPLRPVAFALGAVVLQRLVANPYVLDYGREGAAGLAWILYGYGLPAGAFALAAALFRRQRDDRLVLLLEAGALLFVTCLASFTVRQLTAGSLRAMSFDFGERSLDVLVWLGLALACHVMAARSPRPVFIWGWRILLGLGGGLLLFNLTLFNPLLTYEEVGALPLLNLLALAYLVPAVLALVFAQRFQADRQPWLALRANAAALLLAFVWVSLETRHAFAGSLLADRPMGDSELYAYSLVWILFALALLAAAYFRRSALLRRAGFLALLPAVVKVYLVDMDALTGLLRAGSFLALGLSLFGIAYLNRRLGALEAKPKPPASS